MLISLIHSAPPPTVACFLGNVVRVLLCEIFPCIPRPPNPPDAVLGLLSDPASGTLQDKTRLALAYLLTAAAGPADGEEVKRLLTAVGGIVVPAGAATGGAGGGERTLIPFLLYIVVSLSTLLLHCCCCNCSSLWRVILVGLHPYYRGCWQTMSYSDAYYEHFLSCAQCNLKT